MCIQNNSKFSMWIWTWFSQLTDFGSIWKWLKCEHPAHARMNHVGNFIPSLYSYTVWSRVINFGTVTHLEDGRFSGFDGHWQPRADCSVNTLLELLSHCWRFDLLTNALLGCYLFYLAKFFWKRLLNRFVRCCLAYYFSLPCLFSFVILDLINVLSLIWFTLVPMTHYGGLSLRWCCLRLW